MPSASLPTAVTTPDWQLFSELAGMIRPARVSVGGLNDDVVVQRLQRQLDPA
jgi:hypothetical protein